MTLFREQAIQILDTVPDDKMFYVINMLKNLQGLLSPVSERKKAWSDFQQYRGIITQEIDEKSELAAARDEKYAHFD